jgi:hypothetical protein
VSFNLPSVPVAPDVVELHVALRSTPKARTEEVETSRHMLSRLSPDCHSPPASIPLQTSSTEAVRPLTELLDASTAAMLISTVPDAPTGTSMSGVDGSESVTAAVDFPITGSVTVSDVVPKEWVTL